MAFISLFPLYLSESLFIFVSLSFFSVSVSMVLSVSLLPTPPHPSFVSLPYLCERSSLLRISVIQMLETRLKFRVTATMFGVRVALSFFVHATEEEEEKKMR